jgi:hypothetical protein
VTGTFSGTTSNGGTFSVTFNGPVDPSTRTYTAAGSITFTGAVTGAVDVVINGDCPSEGDDPDAPDSPDSSGGPGPPIDPGTPAAADVSGQWTGTYTLNDSPGTMTWSISNNGGTFSGTFTGSLPLMPSGTVRFGPADLESAPFLALTLTCPNGGGVVVFQGTGAHAGATVTGTFPSVGGGNCNDPTRSSWTVSVVMTRQ